MAVIRALIVVRLSNLTDETTSPTRQRDVCEKYCADRGWEIVGVAEDLDVSATKLAPAKRPRLGPWLDRHDEYDVLLFWRADRLIRSASDFADLVRWGRDNRVTLVSATEPHFDQSTTHGEMMSALTAYIGQIESENTSARTKQAYDHNVRAGKWRGGHLPWGYAAEKSGNGWRLTPDPERSVEVRDVVDKILSGKRPSSICTELNAAGVRTPNDRWHPPLTGGPALWRTGNLTRALRSPSLLGHAVVHQDADGKRLDRPMSLRAEDGSPVMRATPLIDRDTFDRLQRALDDMNGKKSPYKKSTALLLRVLFCIVCGGQMYLNHGRTKMYYRCVSASLGESCGNKAIAQPFAEEQVTALLLGEFGDVERMERVYDPGEDAAAELADIDAQLADIADLIGTPGYTRGTPARDRLDARLASLGARREVLAATDYRAAGYRYVPTGIKFSEHWDSLNVQERNVFLRDAGVRVVAKPFNYQTYWGDLETMRSLAQSH